MLEMSRRVGGAESRCQAQPVRSCAGSGLAGWGPRPVLLFLLEKRTEERPIFENLPMFPAQEPAGGHRRSFHRCSDRGRSLGPLCVFAPRQWVSVSASMSSHAVLAREVV